MTLDSEDIEAIARRVAELLRHSPSIGLVDVDGVVERFGVSRSYVYAHARELGAIRLGDGPKARMRFDLELVAEALSRDESGPALKRSRRTSRGRPRSTDLPSGVKLIEIRSG
jgi:hypothetical protein